MNLIDVTRQFKTDDDCLDYLEAYRWPDGKIGCVHCGVVGRISKVTREAKGKNKRTRLYQCLDCGKQSSPTAGTVFHDSHLPLVKWFMAMALICEAKKGISAKQVARHLGLEKSYKTAWYLCHRIRKAMKEGGLLGEAGGIVEADETYFNPRKPRKGKPYVKDGNRSAVLGMIERGGKLRLIPIADAKMATVEPELRKHVSLDATLQTDESSIYYIMRQRKVFAGHRMINHIRSYAEGENHTNSIENAFSLLKRGIYGTFHQVSEKHLGRYCEEFSYRFNRRGEQANMFDVTLKGLLREKALPFKTLTGSGESQDF
jgi:hypothetical protein